MKYLLGFLLLVPSFATVFTVKSGGGGNFTTIQACATAMANGDTCTVFAGTYNENVTVPAGGVASYKTLTVNGSDIVIVSSFTLNSHTKLIGNCAVGAVQETCGFSIEHPSSPSSGNCVNIGPSSTSVTDIYVANNRMYACALFVASPQASGASVNATFIRIQNNTMSYTQSTAGAPDPGTGANFVGSNWLWDGNDMSHVSDGPYVGGSYFIFRNNNFHDITECNTGGHGGNCHIDFLQADDGNNYNEQYFLSEGNRIYNMTSGQDHAGPLLQCDGSVSQVCGVYIHRYNVINTATSGLTNDSGAGTSSEGGNPWPYVKFYNNTFVNVNVGSGGDVDGHAGGSSNGASLNEIYYWASSQTDWNAYACVGANACTGFDSGHSLAYSAAGGTIRGFQYGSGSFTANPGSRGGNVSSNPNFVNLGGGNYHLNAGSPAIGTGGYLTTVAATDSGTGTTLVVNDAAYFQDSFGFSADGVQSDTIRVGSTTASPTVQIATWGDAACSGGTCINYSTNTIKLASSISRSIGDQVYLYKKSDGTQVLFNNTPDMGAFQVSSAGPAPPTNLQATPKD